MHTGCSKFETQVLIIGNGPAGIALSSFLSGMHPFYNPSQPHDNPTVHERLLANQDYSLLDQDLSWSTDLSELSQTGRPLSVLYDMLVRPGADTGAEAPGCLQWDMNRAREVPHMVIGESKIGGSWNEYDPEMLTVSFSDWLDLPGYSVAQWLGGIPLVKRLPSVAISTYLKGYVDKLRLRKKFHNNFKVTSIKKVSNYWITEGVRTTDDREFVIKSQAVVVACGKTSPKKLELENENLLKSKIVYDVNALKKRLNDEIENVIDYSEPSTSSSEPVVVVGDGISSVDCVRHCLENNIKVIHVMRRNAKQLRNVMMSRLSPMFYSEYNDIYRLMIGRSTNPSYIRIVDANVTKLGMDTIEVSSGSTKQDLKYSTLAVCIGRESHFETVFDDPYKHTFLDYQSQQDDSLFAVGSFAGDHFVRFLVGGCLRVAQHILASPKISTNNNVVDVCHPC